MSSDLAIHAEGLGKAYAMFERPDHRLKQMLFGRWRTWYTQFWALRGVDLAIHRGETWGIIGRNGSGKSTLLQVICGNLAPTTGSVSVRGRVAALLELGAGFNPEFTGRENVYVNGVIAGFDRDAIDHRMDAILAFADIGPFIDQPVKTYSSGMFARLAFAVAINVEPDILIVDEALAVGDEAFQRKCFARMERIKNDGATILFVSHSTSSVVDLCDHAVLLHHGEQLYTGQPKRTVAWYQKLMAAPDEQTDAILAEISADDPRAEEPTRGVGATALGDFGGGLGTTAAATADDEIAGFDANLVSASVLSYAPNGAELSGARLLTLGGEQVNRLLPGDRYVFCYRATFATTARNVKFYCMIKTVNGVHLGGGTYPSGAESLPIVHEGDSIDVRFEFTCAFGAGAYFFNCGVASCGELLHRILDVLTFRVGRGPVRAAIGIIDLDVQAEIERAMTAPLVEVVA